MPQHKIWVLPLVVALCLIQVIVLPGIDPVGADSPVFQEAAATQEDMVGNENSNQEGQICTPPINPISLNNPTLITDCTQAGMQTALDQGGQITFDCGPDPVTIPLTSQLTLNPTLDTVLDGQGMITLDGQGQTRMLFKDWHDPDQVDSVTITLQNLRFINGKAPSGGGTGDHSGGALNVGHPGTRLHIINSIFENNSTTDTATPDNQGGAIFAANIYETVIVDSVFSGNVAGNGGAFGGIATGLFIFNTRFTNNQAVDTTAGGVVRGYGGAVHLDGVTNTYNANSNKRVHICGSTFENNSAIRGGGATVVTVSDNKGTKVTYEKSTFTNNEVFGLGNNYGQGGAIYHIEDEHAGGIDELNLEILNSTFHANRARRQGGATWLYINGRGTVMNSTFEGNTTTAPLNEVGQGGAMAVTLGLIDITNVTFANNHAAYQAGALHGGGANDPGRVITLTNTIFYNNTLNEQEQPSSTEWQGYHTNRPMTDGGQNIQYPEFKPTYNNKVNNNITDNPIYADPLLEPLADNGGSNQTMALQPGSPAIDAGAEGCPDTDQRGQARAGQCDIGAYEYIPNITPDLYFRKEVEDLTDQGDLSFLEAVAYTLTLENRGTVSSTGVVISDTLPVKLNFGGWITQDQAQLLDGHTVQWGPAPVAVSQTIRLVFTATNTFFASTLGSPLGEVITNTAYFSSQNGNSGSASVVFVIGQKPTLIFLPLVLK